MYGPQHIPFREGGHRRRSSHPSRHHEEPPVQPGELTTDLVSYRAKDPRIEINAADRSRVVAGDIYYHIHVSRSPRPKQSTRPKSNLTRLLEFSGLSGIWSSSTVSSGTSSNSRTRQPRSDAHYHDSRSTHNMSSRVERSRDKQLSNQADLGTCDTDEDVDFENDDLKKPAKIRRRSRKELLQPSVVALSQDNSSSDGLKSHESRSGSVHDLSHNQQDDTSVQPYVENASDGEASNASTKRRQIDIEPGVLVVTPDVDTESGSTASGQWLSHYTVRLAGLRRASQESEFEIGADLIYAAEHTATMIDQYRRRLFEGDDVTVYLAKETKWAWIAHKTNLLALSASISLTSDDATTEILQMSQTHLLEGKTMPRSVFQRLIQSLLFAQIYTPKPYYCIKHHPECCHLKSTRLSFASSSRSKKAARYTCPWLLMPQIVVTTVLEQITATSHITSRNYTRLARCLEFVFLNLAQEWQMCWSAVGSGIFGCCVVQDSRRGSRPTAFSCMLSPFEMPYAFQYRCYSTTEDMDSLQRIFDKIDQQLARYLMLENRSHGDSPVSHERQPEQVSRWGHDRDQPHTYKNPCIADWGSRHGGRCEWK